MHQDPVPLSRVAEAAPPELDLVIMRAMAKEPGRRFASTKEMANALAEIEKTLAERHQPATAAPSRAPPARQPQRRWGSYVAVVLLATTLGAGGALVIGRRLPAPSATTAPSGMLLLATDPAGATVELDGKPLAETTPTALRGIAAGAHTIVVRHGARPAVTRKIELGAGERALIELTLPPSSHPLELRSTPNGARVYLDRRLLDGATPLTIEVLDDDLHELRIEKFGFETVVQTLTPDDHEATKSFDLVPERLPRGRLTVDANATAEVWIDGRDTGFTTPTILLPLALGPHRVEVRMPDGSGANRRINIHRGETLRLMLTLAASPSRKDPP